MSEPDPALLRETVFEVIENQMREGTPPETKQTYDRLVADGHGHEETMKLIGYVVISELNDMLAVHELFNEERFVTALHELPEMPWEEDED